MSIFDDDHAGPAIALIGLLIIIVLPIAAIYLNHKDTEATEQEIKAEIKAGNCPVRVATACGDEVCKYTARVPCAELEALIKRGAREP